ncbi:MAG: transporter substrate-binding domain-containing protein [Colwellia sp.]
MFKNSCFSYVVFLSFYLLVAGCDANKGEDQYKEDLAQEKMSSVEGSSKEGAPFTEGAKQSKKTTIEKPIIKRDTFRTWEEIKESGYLIALKLNWETRTTLATHATSSSYHTGLVEIFAKKHNLEVKWLKAKSLNEMFDLLSSFQADIIPRHLTITKDRAKKYSFTYPLLRDNEVVISHANKAKNKKSKNKFNSNDFVTVDVPVGSSYIDQINREFPHWKVNILPKPLTPEALAHKVEDEEIEYTVIDGLAFDVMKSYQTDIEIVFTLPETIELAWATSLGNKSLLRELNEFISVQHLLEVREPKRQTDFLKLRKEKRPLRVITRNSPETYFLWRGELLGFEYEIMNKFADVYNVRLNYIVADTHEEMIEMLKNGEGDIIAAGISRTKERAKENAKDKLVTSIRYNRVEEMIVANKEGPVIKSLEDLKGRTITVRKTSSFWGEAEKLVKNYGAILEAADERVSTEHLIAEVASKKIDLTIADSNLLSIEKSFREEIITPLVVNESVPYAYVLRKNNPQLLAHINEFTRKYYRSTFYNVVKNKYFENESLKKKYVEERLEEGSDLSPYDAIVRSHATPYNLDWRLIVSQMYQESRFNPLASNSTGAKGLMQMMPRTAKELGVKNLKDPEQAIASGVQYLNWTRNRFSEDLPVQEQIFFSLASYNAGYGHVKDAQRLAKKMGWRSDRWFNHVEKAMLLLQKRKYYKKARYGYVRGTEPVNYVRDIHQRYLSYIRITD